MDRPLAVAGLVLAIANLLLHTTGLYLLHILRKRTLKGSQTTLIMHLSMTELLISITHVIKHIATLGKGSEGDGWKIAYEYATLVEYCGLDIVYYLIMIYITLYRCAKIFLGMNFSKYWSDRKTKNLCVATWIVAIALCSAIGILMHLYQIDYTIAFFKFVYPSLDFLFLLLAVIAYSAMFRKYRSSSLRFHSNRDKQRHGQSKNRVTAKFYVPKLLVITFILFMVIPDITVLVYFILMRRQSEVLGTVITIMYTLSVTSDGVIFVFLQDPVRRLLLEKLHIFKDRSDSTATKPHSFYLHSQKNRSVPSRAEENFADLHQVSTIQ